MFCGYLLKGLLSAAVQSTSLLSCESMENFSHVVNVYVLKLLCFMTLFLSILLLNSCVYGIRVTASGTR